LYTSRFGVPGGFPVMTPTVALVMSQLATTSDGASGGKFRSQPGGRAAEEYASHHCRTARDVAARGHQRVNQCHDAPL